MGIFDMGWTRGKDAEQPGKFAYELFDGFETVERVGGFDTPADADRAAEAAQRRHLFPAAPASIDDISDDELAKALGL